MRRRGQHSGPSSRMQRKIEVPILNRKRPRRRNETKVKSPRLEHEAVLIVENRHEHLRPPRSIGIAPIYIKEICERRSGAALQYVLPPLIRSAPNAHVIGHNIQHHAHALGSHRARKIFEGRPATQFGVDAMIVVDVVSMGAPWGGHQHGREITMVHSKIVEIGENPAGVGERKLLPQLQPVG